MLVLLTMTVACGGPRATVGADGGALELEKEQVWQLVAMRGKEVSRSNDAVVLMFHPESGTLRGRVACNGYFGDYELRGVRVGAEGTRYSMEVRYVSGGDVQCPEGDMAAQERYLSLLGKADACLLTPWSLTLFQKGREVLKYELQ